MRRHLHNLSHARLLTGDMGQLLPIGLMEALPGDTFRHSTSALIRLSPMAAPVMHKLAVRIHHFFVPHRLSWADSCGKAFEDFITGGKDGADNSTIPTLNTSGVKNDLFDYYGLNPKVANIAVSALPIRAYNLIWNEYYRDQDLETELSVDQTNVQNCAWQKDYFTAARPWAQKGPEITLPIAGTAPVTGIGIGTANSMTVGQKTIKETGGGTGTYSSFADDTTSPPNVTIGGETGSADSHPAIYADLSQAEAASINDVRKAFALQRFAESRARYGSRYTEYLKYLGVRHPSDARLRRPEFLGGGTVRVAISEVLQTANEATQQRFGVGDLYGHGVGAIRANSYVKFIQEHGYIISLLSVRPRAVYTQGIPRTWLRQTREDFYQRELEFIGQQEVQLNEIYADATSGEQTFGYSDRYREYREEMSRVAAEFHEELNYWHLGRIFSEAPSLNQSMVSCKPSKRIFNEQTRHSLWIAVQHHMRARRLLSRSAYGKII